MSGGNNQIASFSSAAAQRLALAASGRDANQAWKQDSAEALKMPEKRAESRLSDRFVNSVFARQAYEDTGAKCATWPVEPNRDDEPIIRW